MKNNINYDVLIFSLETGMNEGRLQPGKTGTTGRSEAPQNGTENHEEQERGMGPAYTV